MVILTILYLIVAVVMFIYGFWFIALGVLSAGLFGLICTLPFLLFGVFFLLVAFGLFMMKTWAWIVGLIFAILGLLSGLGNAGMLGSIGGDDVDIPGYLIAIPVVNIILNLVIIIYLFKVKPYFRS